MLLNARPTRPSLFVSWMKEPDTCVAISTACLVAVAPPMLTLSKPTVPDALDPSPYSIEKVPPW